MDSKFDTLDETTQQKVALLVEQHLASRVTPEILQSEGMAAVDEKARALQERVASSPKAVAVLDRISVDKLEERVRS